MKAKDFLDLNKWGNRIILAIYLIWFCFNLLLLFLGTPSGSYRHQYDSCYDWRAIPPYATDVRHKYFPIDITSYVIPEHSKYDKNGSSYSVQASQRFLSRITSYDYTEFIFYLTAPVLIFFSIKLIIPPKRK